MALVPAGATLPRRIIASKQDWCEDASVGGYWWDLVRPRAWRDAGDIVGGLPSPWIWPALAGCVILVKAYALGRSTTVWLVVSDPAVWGLLAVNAGVFLWCAVRAVAVIHAEQEQVVRRLRDELRALDESLKFKWLGPSPFEVRKDWEIVLVEGAYAVAMHQEAYGYYLGLSEEEKGRFREYVISGRLQRTFEKGDVLKATDVRKFARTMLDRFIGEGTELCSRLSEFGEDRGSGINIGARSVQKGTVEYWEQRAVGFLSRYFPSDRHEFMAYVGAAPDGAVSLLRRVEARMEFLKKLKAGL